MQLQINCMANNGNIIGNSTFERLGILYQKISSHLTLFGGGGGGGGGGGKGVFIKISSKSTF